MKISGLLCNHAEVQNNLLYIAGGGIDRTVVPVGAPAPWPITLGIAISVTIPWTATNQQHALAIHFLDADGHPVQVRNGPDSIEDFRAQMTFNVGRPPELQIGEDQSVALAINMPGFPIERLGQYTFRVEVDGTPMLDLNYRVVMPQGMTMGSGPTALPRL